jgi:hypothetical protein
MYVVNLELMNYGEVSPILRSELTPAALQIISQADFVNSVSCKRAATGPQQVDSARSDV